LLTPFFGGLSPAGTFLGGDSDLERRMSVNSDLRNGTLTHRMKRGRNVVTEPLARIWDSGVFWATFSVPPSRNSDLG